MTLYYVPIFSGYIQRMDTLYTGERSLKPSMHCLFHPSKRIQPMRLFRLYLKSRRLILRMRGCGSNYQSWKVILKLDHLSEDPVKTQAAQ